MKLVNPTDDQLNNAFAQNVAMWSPNDHDEPMPDWCKSADAVMVWLERSPFDFQINYYQTSSLWTVGLTGRFTSSRQFSGKSDEGMPRAAVIALLRAHGVEVESV